MSTEFIRSEKNPGAIINKDMTALEAYRKQREIFRQNSNLNERVTNLEKSLNRIEQLLEQMVHRNK